jgi:hypothetical protein
MERERVERLDVWQGRGSVEVAGDGRGCTGRGADDGARRGPKSRARARREERLGRAR